MYTLRAIPAAVVICLVCSFAHAGLIVYGTNATHPIVSGGSLEDVSMTVDMEVLAGIAVMTFTNTSSGAEDEAVFKEIVLDTFDDDTDTAILWGGLVLTDTAEVSYDLVASNGLPGYQNETNDAFPLIELRADNPTTKLGISPGEVLHVQFSTSLADGSSITDYVDAFGGGEDTLQYAIGFHAISADTVGGESLSGVIPEPCTLVLLAGGGVTLVLRRRRRQVARAA